MDIRHCLWRKQCVYRHTNSEIRDDWWYVAGSDNWWYMAGSDRWPRTATRNFCELQLRLLKKQQIIDTGHTVYTGISENILCTNINSTGVATERPTRVAECEGRQNEYFKCKKFDLLR